MQWRCSPRTWSSDGCRLFTRPRTFHACSGKTIVGGADFVIGSRYVAGGSIPADWSWRRRLISRGGNVTCRRVADLGGAARFRTAGFPRNSHGCAEADRSGRPGVKGYVFRIALLHAALRAGAQIEEVPVQFVERAHGASSWASPTSSSSSIMPFCCACMTPDFHQVRPGRGAGVAVNLGVFTMLLGLDWNRYLASPFAVELAVASEFHAPAISGPSAGAKRRIRFT